MAISTRPSDSNTVCCNCSSPVGAAAKVQPTTIDDEVWCPRCTVWKRMHMEPDRLSAHQAAAVLCQFCGWTTVSLGARPGRGCQCSHCRRFGAVKLVIQMDAPELRRLTS